MFKPTLVALGVAAMLSAPAYAADNSTPPSSKDLEQIRQEMQQLKQSYEQRLQSLEQRLQAAEAAPPPAPVADATPPAAASAQSGNAFNPKISLIMNGTYAHFSNNTPAVVPGYLLGDETGFTEAGLSLGETELAIEANVDDKFHGWAALSVAPEGGIGVEEAYINTLALPAGFAVKMGRFFSDIGYQNHQHAHAWDFVDAPLVYRTMLGNQLGDDGVQVRWIAPTDLLLELGSELTRGDAFPSGGDNRSNIKAWTAFAHLGGDAGEGGSWRVGLSHLRGNAENRADSADITTNFTGRSNLTILDTVYKWAPQGNPSVTNFVAQAEFFYRKENGSLVYDPDGSANSSNYNGNQRGFYVQGVYQFMPRWRAGVRYDWLSADNTLDNPVAGTSLETMADNSGHPQRYSAMVDFSNSEFSRFRLQFSRDQSRPNQDVDNQVFLQYIFSLGSHPAHQF
ncbi:hypothetical protein [Stenotrophobium rhamnosiphilum]|uniref:Zinc-regulated TonB-dependent outer membrane receptor n=1 Tax=Stenotrophobium rhamnosiphilum TaxID=2029166 RepID=A0A2T5MCR0_9GAMM|nr:hypothetical protein [Stenotrophobium rhamnosiphilum]PTU30366.1 hypothetical protein CJD38_15610 [Stenotrophobium rhamnosiphilum]